MMRFSALCAMLGCSGLMLATSARAQDLPDPPSYLLHHGNDGGWLECDETVNCASIPGERGVWFELSLAEKLVAGRKTLVEFPALVAALEEKVDLIETRLVLCKESESLAIAETHGFEDAIFDATTQKREAEDRAEAAIASRDAWYNAKVLWYGGGLLSAAALLSAAWLVSN